MLIHMQNNHESMSSWGGFFYMFAAYFADLHLQFYLDYMSANFYKVSLQTFENAKSVQT